MTEPSKEAVEDCPFCDYDGPSPILHDFKTAIVFEPLNPVAPGHVLVVPRDHVENFTSRPSVTADVAWCAAAYASFKEFSPDYNLITSKGDAATQTVRHLHFHIVPRREGDGLALPWAPERERWEKETTAKLTFIRGHLEGYADVLALDITVDRGALIDTLRKDAGALGAILDKGEGDG